MPAAVQPVSAAELDTWPTKRLLSLRGRLLRCEASVEASDIQRPEELDRLDPSLIHFKDDPRWDALYEIVKGILNTREHVPGGPERTARRKRRAAHARTHERPSKPTRR